MRRSSKDFLFVSSGPNDEMPKGEVNGSWIDVNCRVMGSPFSLIGAHLAPFLARQNFSDVQIFEVHFAERHVRGVLLRTICGWARMNASCDRQRHGRQCLRQRYLKPFPARPLVARRR